ncbi:hypothetical protein M8542_44360 [Amycolatopsis sp. OK19-0408]|uniref:Uncharacterized protein n=1 Tax=Amycolatopsis iheyensis TaxID=2945988 RepID=A0A9X2NL35_9PSEU|nr:hypothetical protein [Amycolatopsis iheyensis]MCR6489868.1 hypothetical protein [Amycolatopsis iheyensis]
MRSPLGLLVMSGPDALVDAANEVRGKDMQLHHVRHELDEGGEFAIVARKHTS